MSDEIEAITWPRRVRSSPGARVPIFAAIHAAYHRLDRRLQRELTPWRLSSSEALVLLAARRHAPAAVWMIRRETGLRASTLGSILDRLEDRRLIERRRSGTDPRFSEALLTSDGEARAKGATLVLRAIDEELAGYLPEADRLGASAVAEATIVMSPREMPPDD